MTSRLPLADYLLEVSSSSPAPGGGSVAAVAASLCAALGAMVCRFTEGRERFSEHEAEIREILARLDDEVRGLLTRAEDDAQAYRRFHQASSLPRSTGDEKKVRREAIAVACQGAMEVPLDVARRALGLLRDAARLSEVGNPNLVSDVGVMAAIAAAAGHSALFNVWVNLPFLGDVEGAQEARRKARQIDTEITALREEILGKVRGTLEG